MGSLSVLGPSRSSVTAIARVAGTTSEISAAAALHDRVSDDVLPLTQEALAQLLGVRRTTVTPMMSKLRAARAIRSDRRGFVEIDRARLTAWRANARRRCSAGSIACTARKLSAPQPAVAPFQESPIVPSSEAG